MSTIPTAVVAMTMNAADPCLLNHAAAVTRAMGIRQVYLAHVVESLDAPSTSSDTAGEPLDEQVERQLIEGAKQTGGWLPETQFRAEVREGGKSDTIVNLTRQKNADLLCIGDVRAKFPGLSTRGQRLARRSPCSVLAIPDLWPAMYKRLLVPLDFSTWSELALRQALQLQAAFDQCEVVAVHVCDVPAHFERTGSSFEEFAASLQTNAQTRWNELRPDLKAAGRLTFRTEVIPHHDRSHDIAAALLHVAEEYSADLIVCGSKGKSALAQFVLGSTTEGILQRTPRPVLCVKQKGETFGLLDLLFRT